MATVTAIRAFHTRLCHRGKPQKVALAAAMRKLLPIFNAVIRDQALWQAESMTTGHNPCHASCWSAPGRTRRGWRRVDDRANEIKAIPELLETLALDGCIDALGLQKQIAETIRAQGPPATTARGRGGGFCRRADRGF